MTLFSRLHISEAPVIESSIQTALGELAVPWRRPYDAIAMASPQALELTELQGQFVLAAFA